MRSTFFSNEIFLWILTTFLFLKPQDLLVNENLSPLKRRILRKVLENSYKKHFSKFNFKSAYKHRVFLALAYARGYFSTSKLEAKNYLSVISCTDFFQYIELEDCYVKEILRIKEVFDFSGKTSKEYVKKILFLGPAASEQELNDFVGFDLVVFNKPPKRKLEVSSSKLLIILNNIYSKQKSSEILSWKDLNPESRFVSQQDISNVIQADNLFKLIPSFMPFASPMGLQRSLFMLSYCYSFEEIELRGFNFSLNKTPYSEWYPSIMKDENKSNFSEALIKTNLVHDLVFNILLTRLLSNSIGCLKGEAVELSNNNIQSSLDKFRELYN